MPRLGDSGAFSLSETDKAYCAGLMDGEAYIGIKKSKPYNGRYHPGYQARIQIRMVDEPAICFIAGLFGGRYFKEAPSVAKGRPLFCYGASDRIACRVLQALLPYLKVKRKVADTVLELAKLKEQNGRHRTKRVGQRVFPNKYGNPRIVWNLAFSDYYIGLCEALYLRCKELNKVGIESENSLRYK